MVSATTMLIRILIFIAILVLLDLYVFRGVKTITSGLASMRAKQWVHWLYWAVSLSFILFIVYATLTFSRATGPTGIMPVLMGMLILLLIPKLVFAIVLLAEDIYRLFRAGTIGVMHIFGNDDTGPYFVGRRKFISQIGAGLAAIPFAAILYGITKGKYNFTVHNVTLKFPGLPDKFHGFTIAQISDIHSGSFDNADAVKRGVQMVNDQKADMIVFTGDIVNNKAEEMEPWIEVFKKLQAPYGKFSILGNHDYGDYIDWPTPEAKQANFERLKQIHSETGFRLLLNENVSIGKDGQAISLVGIENWGQPPFPQYGILTKAMQGVDPSAFKVLLSHDPSHFESEVIQIKDHIHLTLSGHTHGFQFGIEIPGFRWSPVKYRYPRWAGLYQEAGRYLYVNRGFGFLGFPGRVGIWPEITVIRLEKA
jgi:uncharacterized protein